MAQAVQKTEFAIFDGYEDCEGRFIPFSHADEVLTRARKLGARILLRLELNSNGHLKGMLHTNQRGLGSLKLR